MSCHGLQACNSGVIAPVFAPSAALSLVTPCPSGRSPPGAFSGPHFSGCIVGTRPESGPGSDPPSPPRGAVLCAPGRSRGSSSWPPSRPPRPPLLGLLLQHLPSLLQAPAGIMPSPPSPPSVCWHVTQHASHGTLTLMGAGLGLSDRCFSQQRQDETVVPVRTLRFGCSPVNPKLFPQEMKSLRPTSPRILTSLRYSFPSLEMGQKKVSVSGTSLAVQWLRLYTSTAGVTSSTPGPGKKILHAVRCSQKIGLKKGVHFRGCWEGRAKKGCRWHLVTGQTCTQFHFP